MIPPLPVFLQPYNLVTFPPPVHMKSLRDFFPGDRQFQLAKLISSGLRAQGAPSESNPVSR